MKSSLRTTGLFFGLAAIFAGLAVAQSLPAQTVQLPAVRNFSFSGGVLVPDRGTAFLGGNRSSATGSSARGMPLLPNFPSHSFGSHAAAGGVWATATIIDLDEMDRQILGYDPRDRTRRRAERVTVKSVADEIAEAKSLVRNARRAWQSGQTSTAKHAYELAIERLSRLAKSEAHSGTASGYPHPKTEERLAGRPAYLLAYAQAEYAWLFRVADGPALVQP